MPSDVTLLLRHLLLLKGVLMSPLCSFVTPLLRLCSFKRVLSFIFSDSLSLCFSHPCNGFSLAPWHFSSMFFFRLVFFSPLFSNLNAIVTFVDLINIYPLCDNIFVSTYVMCDLSLKIHPLNFGNAYLECFASEPCFQHYSGWSFLSFLLLLHFIPVALCPMSFSTIPNHLWSLWHLDNFCWTFDFFVSVEIILIFYSRSHRFIFWWLVLLLSERFFFSTSSAPSSLNDE